MSWTKDGASRVLRIAPGLSLLLHDQMPGGCRRLTALIACRPGRRELGGTVEIVTRGLAKSMETGPKRLADALRAVADEIEGGPAMTDRPRTMDCSEHTAYRMPSCPLCVKNALAESDPSGWWRKVVDAAERRGIKRVAALVDRHMSPDAPNIARMIRDLPVPEDPEP